MERFTTFITEHNKLVVGATFALALVCAILILFVRVNYDLAAYLPESTESKRAFDVIDEQFNERVPNARVMVRNVNIAEALAYKEKLQAIEHVTEVVWLDDVASITTPLEMLNQTLVEEYYHEGNALFEVAITSGAEPAAVEEIYALIGPDNHVTGQAVSTAEAEVMTGNETTNAVMILIPIVILVLILSTRSWLEPLFFLLAIGVSILMNFGTSIIMGEICFITMTVSPILQMAVSLDYAIFLLHAFQRFRETESNVAEAMRKAMKKSFVAIAASAATTFFGFAALIFMRFGIGADLGLSLMKGVVFSFLSVVIFLPAFTLMAYKLIDKTQHRRLVPSFKNIGKPFARFRIPVFLLVLVVIVPCFLAQSHTTFTYGMESSVGSETRSARDTAVIKEQFGHVIPSVVLVPRGDSAREAALVEKIETLPKVSSVVSYANKVGVEIPVGFLDDAINNRFYSNEYTRIIVYADILPEGDEAFGLIEDIRSAVQSYYGEAGMTTGQVATLYDMKLVVTEDNKITNLIAVLAILLVLIIAFRSAVLPLILLATIESAIFINLAIPYFMDETLIFIGFLIINTVQLGATVDYAILFTENYRTYRQTMNVHVALLKSFGDAFFSILVSASILASAGFALWITSTNNIVSVLGLLLFRGALLSFLMVVTFLPAALLLFDKAIGRLTWRANFFQEKAKHERPNKQRNKTIPEKGLS
ncbi:MAG: MMPL family transporter [Eggerthellaceae bacterium]|nr:MMPL family transporter [Eggerthellaceae bacterium]